MKMRGTCTALIEVAELNIDDLIACDAELEATFDFQRGYPARVSGPADDCEPGCADEFDFITIKAVGNVWFFNDESDLPVLKFADGEDIRARLGEDQIAAIEEILLASITGDSHD